MKLILWSCVVILLITGAIYGGWTFTQQRTLNDTTQTLNLGTASSQDQAMAETIFNTFVVDLRHGVYDQALKATSATYPTPHSTKALADLANAKFNPLVVGEDFHFAPVHLTGSRQKLYLRVQLRAEGKNYGTVCTLSKFGGTWLISDILPPVASNKPVASHTGAVVSNGSGAPAGGKK